MREPNGYRAHMTTNTQGKDSARYPCHGRLQVCVDPSTCALQMANLHSSLHCATSSRRSRIDYTVTSTRPTSRLEPLNARARYNCENWAIFERAHSPQIHPISTTTAPFRSSSHKIRFGSPQTHPISITTAPFPWSSHKVRFGPNDGCRSEAEEDCSYSTSCTATSPPPSSRYDHKFRASGVSRRPRVRMNRRGDSLLSAMLETTRERHV